MLRRVESDREFSILIEIETLSYAGGKNLVSRTGAMKIWRLRIRNHRSQRSQETWQ
jgi:hypothetical protein